MKTIKLTEDEIEMLLHGYDAWAANDGDTEYGGYSRKERKNMKSARKVLWSALTDILE